MLFVPNKIVVGFKERQGTFDGRLSYVTYRDAKGKLRKEDSWESWRDSKIDSLELDNNPQMGLMLNKGVRGESYGWDRRQAYARVYDPRGFEFEIDMETLVYLIKNAGYSDETGFGETIYGWESGRLVLIPTASEDYSKIKADSDRVLKQDFVKAADLVVGHVYQRASGTKQIYLGKLDVWTEAPYHHSWDMSRDIDQTYRGKLHVFWEGMNQHSKLKSISQTFVADLGEVEDWSEFDTWSSKPRSLEDVFDMWYADTEGSPVDLTLNKVVYLTPDMIKAPEKGKSAILRFLSAHITKEVQINAEGMVDIYGPGVVDYYRRMVKQETITPTEFIERYHPYWIVRHLANGKQYDIIPISSYDWTYNWV